jgi:hypothetical protein
VAAGVPRARVLKKQQGRFFPLKLEVKYEGQPICREKRIRFCFKMGGRSRNYISNQ